MERGKCEASQKIGSGIIPSIIAGAGGNFSRIRLLAVRQLREIDY